MNVLVQTADGSNTLFNPIIGEHYHSSHGALQESEHVFIQSGLKHFLSLEETNHVRILEVGFGTGLNFILTLDFCLQNNIKLQYTGIEAFPLSVDIIKQTGYQNFVTPETWDIFTENYEKAKTSKVQLTANCTLEIKHLALEQFTSTDKYDIVYYDAFSVRHQPEMWSNEIIAHTCSFLKSRGIFITYAITGNLKRAVKSCGFEIEKIKGAPGKREMLRALKH
ncbi:tRNA (5-methylaminomethyl-2-thiouridine)(34)-methyltransferase MnmD [Pedobacter montanisoli]|uniref:tRNA (5-methylaminomethyl-2-thiouridine)(34)-methyltransferase MnmD n=1 Tax=Pedobacter montanisoli TaxID=2923277 RepID=A0ABS9ZW30_9SPHI|nr:tRNA (5-methylaminomethyl-2-thiouridine)(34)-methyltransferase MnmD [Pedobacter montanisoli]MCJ0742515.1 tRNA (5-methylaminomethyl-2-thiouridine)(34)-methyltransferase MnmD [Pedobacter montanisoli]